MELDKYEGVTVRLERSVYTALCRVRLDLAINSLDPGDLQVPGGRLPSLSFTVARLIGWWEKELTGADGYDQRAVNKTLKGRRRASNVKPG